MSGKINGAFDVVKQIGGSAMGILRQRADQRILGNRNLSKRVVGSDTFSKEKWQKIANSHLPEGVDPSQAEAVVKAAMEASEEAKKAGVLEHSNHATATMAYREGVKGMGAGNGYKNAAISDEERLKSIFMGSDGKYSAARIAGGAATGYMGLSAAGRIASGGGLYRDSNGNFDIIGIPII